MAFFTKVDWTKVGYPVMGSGKKAVLDEALKGVPPGHYLLVVTNPNSNSERKIIYKAGDDKNEKLCRIYNADLLKMSTLVHYVRIVDVESDEESDEE